MITINTRYMADASIVAAKLEALGFTVATTDKIDRWYEDDQTRDHKQNLSAHDWETEEEWRVLHPFIKTYGITAGFTSSP